MLTASQVEVVAYLTDGGFLHAECARETLGDGAVEIAREGIERWNDPEPLRPVIRYELDEADGERAYQDFDIVTYRERTEEWLHERDTSYLEFGAQDGPFYVVPVDEDEPEEGAETFDTLASAEDGRYERAGESCDHCGGLLRDAPLASDGTAI